MSELEDAIELAGIVAPYRNYSGSGGIWAGRNNEFPDGHFTDWGLARATAIILNAAVEGRLGPREQHMSDLATRIEKRIRKIPASHPFYISVVRENLGMVLSAGLLRKIAEAAARTAEEQTPDSGPKNTESRSEG